MKSSTKDRPAQAGQRTGQTVSRSGTPVASRVLVATWPCCSGLDDLAVAGIALTLPKQATRCRVIPRAGPKNDQRSRYSCHADLRYEMSGTVRIPRFVARRRGLPCSTSRSAAGLAPWCCSACTQRVQTKQEPEHPDACGSVVSSLGYLSPEWQCRQRQCEPLARAPEEA